MENKNAFKPVAYNLKPSTHRISVRAMRQESPIKYKAFMEAKSPRNTFTSQMKAHNSRNSSKKAFAGANTSRVSVTSKTMPKSNIKSRKSSVQKKSSKIQVFENSMVSIGSFRESTKNQPLTERKMNQPVYVDLDIIDIPLKTVVIP